MKWRVSTKAGDIQITGAQLVRQLSEKIARARKRDIDVLTTSVTEYLEVNQALPRMRISDILHLGILTGYFYKQFLENNKVTLEYPDEDSTLDSKSSSTSTSTSS